jgi:hypothetical protein
VSTDVENCGGCGISCLLDGTRTICAAGACAITACTPSRLDCNGSFADGCETTGVLSYVDADGDGFGTGAGTLGCTLMGAAEGTDCDDTDPRAFPGQTTFFETPRMSGGFDYDCNGVATPEIRVRSVCGSGPMCMLLQAGWVSTVPGCGMSATFTDECGGTGPCYQSMVERTQRCH